MLRITYFISEYNSYANIRYVNIYINKYFYFKNIYFSNFGRKLPKNTKGIKLTPEISGKLDAQGILYEKATSKGIFSRETLEDRISSSRFRRLPIYRFKNENNYF